MARDDLDNSIEPIQVRLRGHRGVELAGAIQIVTLLEYRGEIADALGSGAITVKGSQCLNSGFRYFVGAIGLDAQFPAKTGPGSLVGEQFGLLVQPRGSLQNLVLPR